MVKKEIQTRKNSFATELEYDEEKYDIKYVKSKHVFLLIRLEDNEVVEILNDKIGFCVQVDKDKKTNFIVSDYSDAEKNGKAKIIHYIDNGDSTLSKVKEFECGSVRLDECRVGNTSTFIVSRDVDSHEKKCYDAFLYNLEERTLLYNYIYYDKESNELYGKDVVMVQELHYSDAAHKFSDTITYGINANTYRIETPIWSEFQQRLIPIYSQEEAKKVLLKYCYYINEVNDIQREAATLKWEVIYYLLEAAKHFDAPASPYEKKMVDRFTRKKDN